YKLVDFTQPYNAPSNATAMGSNVKVYVCPSDYMNLVPAGRAKTNYRASEGTQMNYSWGDLDSAGTNNPGLTPAPNGPAYCNGKYRSADITDGTSNTAAFSEHVSGDFSDAIPTLNSDWFNINPNFTMYPATFDEAVTNCRNLDWQNLQWQGHS